MENYVTDEKRFAITAKLVSDIVTHNIPKFTGVETVITTFEQQDFVNRIDGDLAACGSGLKLRAPTGYNNNQYAFCKVGANRHTFDERDRPAAAYDTGVAVTITLQCQPSGKHANSWNDKKEQFARLIFNTVLGIDYDAIQGMTPANDVTITQTFTDENTCQIWHEGGYRPDAQIHHGPTEVNLYRQKLTGTELTITLAFYNPDLLDDIVKYGKSK